MHVGVAAGGTQAHCHLRSCRISHSEQVPGLEADRPALLALSLPLFLYLSFFIEY